MPLMVRDSRANAHAERQVRALAHADAALLVDDISFFEHLRRRATRHRDAIGPASSLRSAWPPSGVAGYRGGDIDHPDSRGETAV